VFLLLFAVVVVEGMVSGTVFVVVHHHRAIIILGGERGHFVHTRALFLRERLCFKDCDTRERVAAAPIG
jgi:hypothetical protein